MVMSDLRAEVEMAVSCMRNASGHNYRNSSFIVDLAVGQIPRSRERISSFWQNFTLLAYICSTLKTAFNRSTTSNCKRKDRKSTETKCALKSRLKIIRSDVV